ncbi:water chloroplastic isoform A [Chlorella sorokiniana]|uniref:Water chloroplastic isoform A n=1 Tax=Chlorella sorokiniana TaxID=3076 RepID=A0A2P6TUZ2_CHLSO|nr:water chloroplastic isoform A [Chlorella sorokiniana]|eukprot:PRW57887.1 water chloroplastic isoform A [Chlorella sorokiniana]
MQRAAYAAGAPRATGQPCPARQLLGGTRPLLAPALPQGRYGAARRAGQPAARLAAVRRPGRPLAVPCRAAGGDVPVKFTLQRKLKFGEVHKLVGSHPSLGSWKIHKAYNMGWAEGHFWTAEVALPPGTQLEFKCVQVRSDNQEDAKWEKGDNRTLTVPPEGAAAISVLIDWSGEAEIEVTPNGRQPVAAAAAVSVMAAAEGTGSLASAGSDSEGGYASSGAVSGSVTSSMDDSMALLPQWQGKELRFMQSNEHTRERQGVWNTDGLQGAALHLVAGDRDAPNWLSKLEVLKTLLVDQAPEMRPQLDAVAHAYIYIQWMATGAIPCVEGGGHHRPNRHAELARTMFRSLEWVIGEQGLSNPVVALVGRRLQSRLPSFTERFTQSVPLTRIRDIAHRNDIPKELKAEIKHTLQNKLHRNAGPEDLHTTEAMLARVTAVPGEYPEAFVEEFKTFTAELRDFFNAGSLTDMLDGLRPAMDDGSAQLLDHFAAAKGRLDAAGEAADLNAVMDVLHAATTVRALLASGLSSGLRNDAPDNAIAMRQRWRQCEVRAEDYAFVLFSRFINAIEEQGGAQAISRGSDGGWALPIGALVLGLRHIGLSGFGAQECMAIEHELTAWQKAGGFSDRDNALRLKATLQRLRRLTEAYSSELMGAYTARAVAMGKALGLDPDRYNVFTEAEIRASLVFQLSKLSSLLIKAANLTAGGSPWDVVMAGEATGLLLAAEQLQPGCLDGAGGKDAILLVESATGDEEVAALGRNLRGIILRQDLPHLSHLGVRTRQEGVVFVTCEDTEAVASRAEPLLGSRIRLTAGPNGVSIAPAGSGSGAAAANGNGTSAAAAAAAKPVAKPGAVDKVGSMTVVPLEEAVVPTCGAKAAACGELLRLAASCQDAVAAKALAAASNGGSNSTSIMASADGVVLPFGCMEAALAADGQQRRFADLLRQLASVLGSMQHDHSAHSSEGNLAALDAVCDDIQGVLRGLRIPQAVLQRISGAFKPGSAVIARSSANVEDLAGMSGAGLYESIPNVDSSNAAAVQAAVAGVWASLFSRRAVLSRHAAGVPQEAACMAVFVQRQLAPDLSFVLHTRHPVSGDPNVLSAELAPGLGETLAAGTRGTPWRLEVDKRSAAVTTVAFSNFSKGLLPPGSAAALRSTNGAVYAPLSTVGGSNGGAAVAPPPAAGGVQLQGVDYSSQALSVSADARTGVGRRLLAVAVLLESEFGAAQDVEGCFVGNELFVPLVVGQAPDKVAVAALLAQRDAVRNWEAFKSDNAITGWTNASDVCAWTGITCLDGAISTFAWQCSDGEAAYCGVRAQGTISPALANLTSLRELWMGGQQFTGTLPAVFGGPQVFENLVYFMVGSNQLSGTIPASFGSAGAFPKLETMWLSNNRLQGSLPFGGTYDGSVASFTKLSLFTVEGNNLTGSLPPNLPSVMPSLKELYAGKSGLEGSLPDAWAAPGSFPNLTQLVLSNNRLNGTLPAAWATPDALQALSDVFLEGNRLSGSLPEAWGSTPGAFLKFNSLQLESNNLTGTVPVSWASLPALQGLTLNNNPGLCGAVPAGLHRAVCGPLGFVFTQCEGQELPPCTNNWPAASEAEVAALLDQAAAITNWQEFSSSNNITGWQRGVPVCSWTGLTCTPAGAVTGLNLSCAQSTDTIGVYVGACGTRAVGTLAPALASLTYLRSLRLSGQLLSGGLPEEWGTTDAFTNLYELYLDNNQLSGTLPEAWAAQTAFPSLTAMVLDSNRLQGSLPDAWTGPGAFSLLSNLQLSNNSLTGGLPNQASGLQALAYLELGANRLTSTFPAAWCGASAFPGLSYLHLQDNAISGSLPATCGGETGLANLFRFDLNNNQLEGPLPSLWGQNGSLPSLAVLGLGNNRLSGTLPSDWGRNGSFPQLSDLHLDSNQLRGSIPASWAAPGALPSMAQLFLDGNPRFCGMVPERLVPSVCQSGATTCDYTSIPCQPQGSPPPAPQQQQDVNVNSTAPPTQPASSSLPVGVIVGAVVGAFVAALLAFLAVRYRKAWLRRQAVASDRAASLLAKGLHSTPGDGQLAPGMDPHELTMLPPSSSSGEPAGLPHSYVSSGSGRSGSLLPGVLLGDPSLSIGALEDDELLSLISTRLATRALDRPQGQTHPSSPGPQARSPAALDNSGSGGPSSPGLSPDVQQWEVQWEHISIERAIGRGSYGRVYLGLWNATPVAVKVLLCAEQLHPDIDLALPPSIMKELHEEAEVMTRMRHPHLVSFMGLCTLPPCILTEYCSRGSLYDVLRQAALRPDAAQQLTVRRRLSMAFDAARGLLYLHARTLPIVHHDVKSPNMLVDDAWRVKVCDFALSAILAQPQQEQGGVTNPMWLAPEVLRQEPATTKADVFAFGLVLFELLVWRLPWVQVTPFQIRRFVLDGRRPEVPPQAQLPGPDTACWAGLGDYLQLMRDCWAQAPEERPAFSEVVARLGHLLSQAPTGMEPAV